MLLGLFLFGMSLPAAAQAVIVVNSATDDVLPNDERCELREALENANVNTDTTNGDCVPGIGAADRIHFAIGGPGPHVISLQPTRPALAILDPVTIDGYTQPGAAPNTAPVGSNAVLMVEIEPDLGAPELFNVPTGGSTIRGLLLKNYQTGIMLIGNQSVENVIEGNHFDGGGGGAFGVVVRDGAGGNTIGGTTAGARNVFFGHVLGGMVLDGPATTGNLVLGNYVGTDPSGTVALANGVGVVLDNGATGNTIGGTTAGARNVISGNTLHGVQIDGSNGNLVQGNFIGLDASGAGALGNAGEGVVLANGATGNTIGGDGGGAGNTIAFNGTTGVLLTANAGTGNAILGNRFFDNGGLGIDLGQDGPTPNDPGDGDAGPNNLQNTALLLAAGFTGAATVVRATLNSTPNTSFRLDFFSNPTADPSGFGEGETFLGFVPAVVTDAAGNLTFSVNVPGDLTDAFITVTATDPGNSTSEFSNAHVVNQPDLSLTMDDGDVTARPGQGIDYRLDYANIGDQFVTGVLITETLPDHTRFDPANSTPGWIDVGEGAFAFDLGTLAAGAAGTLNFGVIVDDPLPPGVDQISNTAAIADDGAIGPDANPDDNTATIDTPVDVPPPQAFDFGDAPDPTYPTRLASDGARHVVQSAALFLGTRIDAEGDGQPNDDASGDDDAGLADEDGVKFPAGLIIGQTVAIEVTASASVSGLAGLLDAWIDFNADGDWNDAGEQIFASRPLSAGVNGLSFAVPGTARAQATYARFRLSSIGRLAPTGPAEDGEVEDYRVVLVGQADLELAKRVDNAEVEVGQDVVFTVTLSNRGPGMATAVVVADRLPGGLAFVDATASQGAYAAATGVWTVGALGVNASATLEIVATLTEPGQHVNTAEVASAGQPDPDSVPGDGQGDDFSRATVVGLVQEVEVAPASVNFGETLVFGTSAEQTVTVRNVGSASLDIQRIALEGPDAASFVIVRGGEAGTLAPTDPPREVILQGTPRRVGVLSAVLRVVTTAGDAAVALRVTGVAPTLGEPVLPTEPAAGQALEIRATITEGFEPDVRQLAFRLGGQETYQTRDLVQQGNVLVGTIPAEAITERGIDFFIRMSKDDVSVTFPPTNPEANPVHRRVPVAQRQAAGTFPPAAYRMISVPLDLQDPRLAATLTDDYGEADPSVWRLLRWRFDRVQPDTGRYVAFPELMRPFTPGTAFWLITRDGLGFDVEGGLSVDASEPFVLILDPGWNQIGSPFAFAVLWQRIASSGAVQGPFFFDGVEYRLDRRTLVPWEGYFVFNPNAETIRLTVQPVEAPAEAAKTAQDLFPEADFVLQLRAEAPATELRDTWNFVGFSEQAGAGWDLMDLPEPPGVGEHLRLSLVQEGGRFASVFKPPEDGGGQWDFELGAALHRRPPSGTLPVRVTLEAQRPLPAGYAVYVIDLDEGRALPVVDDAFTAPLTAERPQRRLRLIVGTEAFAEARREAALVPADFVLEQNYPNPFNPETVIRYGLGRPSRVVLAVYNALGQRVRTLVEAQQRGGRYEVTWDGLDEAGRPVASGVYVYRLQAGAATASRTMLLLR